MARERTHGPVVSGTFYPDDPATLRRLVVDMLVEAAPGRVTGRLRGLVVPHAGLVFSGPVAATGYTLLAGSSAEALVLIGPSHFEPFDGLAALDAAGWRTPLGTVPVVPAPEMPGVSVSARAYRSEHCLEVQLPFLQQTTDGVPVLPLLTGYADAGDVTDVLDVITGEARLLIVSTDLSHYEGYETARRLDEATADAVVALDAGRLRPGSACGLTGLQAAIGLARRRNWRIQLLDLRNSGDTAGPRDRVVGYGAFALLSP